MRGEVLEADPPRRLVMTWQFTDQGHGAPSEDAPSRVTWEIEAAHGDCKLTLVHDGFAGETETYRIVTPGWPPILSSLKSLLETGQPLAVAR